MLVTLNLFKYISKFWKSSTQSYQTNAFWVRLSGTNFHLYNSISQLHYQAWSKVRVLILATATFYIILLHYRSFTVYLLSKIIAIFAHAAMLSFRIGPPAETLTLLWAWIWGRLDDQAMHFCHRSKEEQSQKSGLRKMTMWVWTILITCFNWGSTHNQHVMGRLLFVDVKSIYLTLYHHPTIRYCRSIDWLMGWSTNLGWLINWLIDWVGWLIDWLNDWLISRLINRYIDISKNQSIGWLMDWSASNPKYT